MIYLVWSYFLPTEYTANGESVTCDMPTSLSDYEVGGGLGRCVKLDRISRYKKVRALGGRRYRSKSDLLKVDVGVWSQF